MKKRFLGFVNFVFCLWAVVLNLNSAMAGTPVVHISPRPAWLSTCKPYDKQPSLRTIEGGYFFELVEQTPAIVFEYGSTFIPIGGWLILVAIGLFLTPVLSLVNLNNGDYFDMKTWAKMATYTHRAAFKTHFVFEMCGHVIFLCFSVFCLVLFLKKRDILPRCIIAYFVFGLVFNIANMVFVNSIPNVQVPESYLNAVIRSVVTAAIWIPYFIVSTRVKETFIVPYPSYNYSYESAEDAMYKDE